LKRVVNYVAAGVAFVIPAGANDFDALNPAIAHLIQLVVIRIHVAKKMRQREPFFRTLRPKKRAVVDFSALRHSVKLLNGERAAALFIYQQTTGVVVHRNGLKPLQHRREQPAAFHDAK
jgi:hypothetical protein